MDKSKQISHIQAMASYLEGQTVAQNRDTIEDELVDVISRGERDPDIAHCLLSLGCARALKTYVDRHGFMGLENGTVDVLDTLACGYGPDEGVESLKVIKDASFLDHKRKMVKVIKIFGFKDAPKAVEQAMQVLDLAPHMLPRALNECIAWGPTLPKMSIWFADFLENHFDEKDTDWAILQDKAIFAPYPHLLGAFLKMGVNIVPGLISSQVENGEFAFIPRIIERANSSHARLALVRSLPPVSELLAMQSHEVVELIAGPVPEKKKRTRAA
jgi:hypothetical protein